MRQHIKGHPAAIGFILLIADVALLSNMGKLLSGLATLGNASMAIYLVHVFFQIALNAVGVQNLWVHVVSGTVLGVIGPVVVLIYAEKLSLRRVLGL